MLDMFGDSEVEASDLWISIIVNFCIKCPNLPVFPNIIKEVSLSHEFCASPVSKG